jgi:trk system potassium uptake protein TrkA
VRIVLVGGGKVGSFLARELEKAGHAVAVIEENAEHAQKVTDETKVLVLEGDGTDVALLKAADIHRSDWLLAVTGLDEVNLVACQLALTFGTRRVLARLNNPRNRPTFEALNIPVVAVTDLMATLISQEVEQSDLHHITMIGRGRISVYEVEIPKGFPECTLAELSLPEGALLATVVNEEGVAVPSGNTRIKPGDRVTAVSTVAMEDDVWEALHHPRKRRR